MNLPSAVMSPDSTNTILWQHPRSWPTNGRTRKFISFTDRRYSREGDLEILKRSAEKLLERQDTRGSFYSDAEYLLGDKVDDQMGGASVIAAYLALLDEANEAVRAALNSAVRYHLDHLVWKSPSRAFRYTRSFPDREENDDWCGQLWCLWGATLTYDHGARFLAKSTAKELRQLLDEYWGTLSTWPIRDEQPCHNQRLAYCEVGIAYARTIGAPQLISDLIDYYHAKLRPLRIKDRGHWIFSEFNQWDIHYGALSWMMLEHLHAATGDPIIAEDADEMARYFSEQISVGGYCWGGPRNNECGIEEFSHIFQSRGLELGMDRVLLQEPANAWDRLAMDGHYGRGLVTRIGLKLPRRPKREREPTPWHFQQENASVCLKDDFKLHLLSAWGLELIPAVDEARVGSGLTWSKGGVWKSDPLQKNPPKASERLAYNAARPFRLRSVAGLSAMQRGYLWETRQWWIARGEEFLWVVHLIAHGLPQWDQLEFVLGTPVLTRTGGEAVPVSSVKNDQGAEMDTQGEAMKLSGNSLRFGDVCVSSSLPLEFRRPARDSFHTFPSPVIWRDVESSNQLRVKVSETPGKLESRESRFFAVAIGRDISAIEVESEPKDICLKFKTGSFHARQAAGLWSYAFADEQGEESIPSIAFGSPYAMTSIS